MDQILNETFQKHRKLLHEHLNINESKYYIEENVDLVNEGFKETLVAMAMAGLVFYGGKDVYDNFQLKKKWDNAYEQILVSDPKKAESIKYLMKSHKHSRRSIWSKFFGHRHEVEKEIDTIINNFKIENNLKN